MLIVASIVFLRGFLGAIMGRKVVPTLERWRRHFSNIRQHGRWNEDQDQDPARNGRLNFHLIDDANTIVAKTVVNPAGDSPVLSDSATMTIDSLRGYGTDFENLAKTLIDYLVSYSPTTVQNERYTTEDHEEYEDDRSLAMEEEHTDFLNAISEAITSEPDFQTAPSAVRSTRGTMQPSIFDEISMASSASRSRPAMSSKMSIYTARTHHSFYDPADFSVTSGASHYLLDELASAVEDVTPQASFTQHDFESAENSLALDESMREKSDATDAARLLSMLSAREAIAH